MKGTPSLLEKIQFWKKKEEVTEGESLIGAWILLFNLNPFEPQHCTVDTLNPPSIYNLADGGSVAAEDVPETEEQLVERRKKEKAEVPPPHPSERFELKMPSLCNVHGCIMIDIPFKGYGYCWR
jgi:hypothetical protein